MGFNHFNLDILHIGWFLAGCHCLALVLSAGEQLGCGRLLHLSQAPMEMGVAIGMESLKHL